MITTEGTEFTEDGGRTTFSVGPDLGHCGQRVLALILVAGLLPLSAGLAAPQPTRAGDSVGAIAKSCGEILERDRTAPPDYVIGRDHPSDGSPGPWQTFRSAAELQKVATYAHFEDQAWVWRSDGNIVHARITLPTQAWTTIADYCFQSGGTIGRVTSDVQNFAVNQIAHHEWAFDAEGRVKDITEKFLDLDTGKPKKPERDLTPVDTTIYFKVADLPFASLLARPGAGP